MVDEDFSVIDGGEPEWALETTQATILKRLEELLKSKTVKEAGSILDNISKNVEKLSKNNEKSFKTFSKTFDDIKDTGKSSDEKAKKISESLKKMGADVRAASVLSPGPGDTSIASKGRDLTDKVSKSILRSPTTFGKTLSSATGGLKSFVGGLNLGIPAILTFSAVMGALGGYVSNTIDGYRELMMVGQDFNGSMIEMRRQAADMGMGFKDFTKIMTKYSKITKGVGTQSFVSLQNRVRDLNKDFGQFGLTTQQTSEFTAEYLERQIRAGLYQEGQVAKQARGVQEYMFQLSSLSKITGRHREEMAKDIKKISENVDIRIATSLMDEEAAERYRRGLEMAGPAMVAVSSEISDQLTQAVAESAKFGNIAMSTLGRTAAVISGPLIEGLKQFDKGIRSGGEGATAGLAKFYNALADRTTLKRLGNLARAGDEGAKQLMGMIGAYENMTNTQKQELAKQMSMSDAELKVQMENTKREMEAQEKLTKQMLDMQSAWGRIMGTIEGAIIDFLAPILTKAFTAISEFLESDTFENILNILKITWDKIFKVSSYIHDNVLKSVIAFWEGFSKFLKPIFVILLDSFDQLGKYMSGFYNLMEEIGILWLFEQLGKVLGFLFTGVAVLADSFLHGLNSMIDAIRSFVWRMKNLSRLFASEEEVQKALAKEKAERDKERGVTEKVTIETNKSSLQQLDELERSLTGVPTEIVPGVGGVISPPNIQAAIESQREATVAAITAIETVNPVGQAAIETAETNKKMLETLEHQNRVLMSIAESNERTARSTKKSESPAFNVFDMGGGA